VLEIAQVIGIAVAAARRLALPPTHVSLGPASPATPSLTRPAPASPRQAGQPSQALGYALADFLEEFVAPRLPRRACRRPLIRSLSQ